VLKEVAAGMEEGRRGPVTRKLLVAAGTCAGRRRRVSGGGGAETTTTPGGTAHLARRRPATAVSARRSDTGPVTTASDRIPTAAHGQQWV
jgi:hypothetical protein